MRLSNAVYSELENFNDYFRFRFYRGFNKVLGSYFDFDLYTSEKLPFIDMQEMFSQAFYGLYNFENYLILKPELDFIDEKEYDFENYLILKPELDFIDEEEYDNYLLYYKGNYAENVEELEVRIKAYNIVRSMCLVQGLIYGVQCLPVYSLCNILGLTEEISTRFITMLPLEQFKTELIECIYEDLKVSPCSFIDSNIHLEGSKTIIKRVLKELKNNYNNLKFDCISYEEFDSLLSEIKNYIY